MSLLVERSANDIGDGLHGGRRAQTGRNESLWSEFECSGTTGEDDPVAVAARSESESAGRLHEYHGFEVGSSNGGKDLSPLEATKCSSPKKTSGRGSILPGQ